MRQLSTLGHEIRVLVVGSGHRHTPIHASVDIIDLDDPKREKYATLSYTWGDQPKSQVIHIHGEEVSVTSNLFNALQYLRPSDQPLTVWVDAICINQDDNEEKSFSVAKMDDVYKKCEIVHMWLGCSEQPIESHHSPFALVEHFRDDRHFFELPGYWWDEDAALWKCNTQDAEFRSMMDAFLLIHDSTWWIRSWTAQEAILPSLAVFHYGHWTLSLEDFEMCRVNRIRHLGSPCCVVAYQATGDAPGPRASIDKLMGVIEWIKSIQDPNGPYRTLIDVFRVFADRQCYNPRDKIYSLLGFLRDEPPIVPDYNQSVGEIYVKAFCAMIKQKKGSLSTLLGEGFNSGNLGLPSWVPDFSGTYREPRYSLTRAFRADPLFNASRGRPGNVEIVDEKMLQVAGCCIDRVQAKSKFINAHLTTNRGEIFEDWRRTCRDNGININTSKRDKAFSLLLAGEMSEDLLTTKYRQLQDEDQDLPNDVQWERYMGPTADGSTLPRPYRITVNCMIDGKVLFVTSGGRMGLSWPTVEVGDEVWILDGSNTPFLLRKPAESIQNSHRLLVGDVYVYGVMHGEAVDKDRASESVILV